MAGIGGMALSWLLRFQCCGQTDKQTHTYTQTVIDISQHACRHVGIISIQESVHQQIINTLSIFISLLVRHTVH